MLVHAPVGGKHGSARVLKNKTRNSKLENTVFTWTRTSRSLFQGRDRAPPQNSKLDFRPRKHIPWTQGFFLTNEDKVVVAARNPRPRRQRDCSLASKLKKQRNDIMRWRFLISDPSDGLDWGNESNGTGWQPLGNHSANNNPNDSWASADFKDSEVLSASIKIYGSTLFALVLLFSCLRLQFPRVYNVRDWVDDSTLRTHLAADQFGFVSWMWRVYEVSDNDMMEECGMDALCFVRLIEMGFRLRYGSCIVSVLCVLRKKHCSQSSVLMFHLSSFVIWREIFVDDSFSVWSVF